jgi:hypothetical protein
MRVAEKSEFAQLIGLAQRDLCSAGGVTRSTRPGGRKLVLGTVHGAAAAR